MINISRNYMLVIITFIVFSSSCMNSDEKASSTTKKLIESEDGGQDAGDNINTRLYFDTSLYNYVPIEILIAAKNGLESYINSDVIFFRKYNLSGNQELLKLGLPYEMKSFNFPGLLNETGSGIVYFKPHTVWKFPVIINDNAVVTIMVAYFSGAWKTVGIGSAVFARESSEKEKQMGFWGRRLRRAFLSTTLLDIGFLCYSSVEQNIENGRIYLTNNINEYIGYSWQINVEYSLNDILPELIEHAKLKINKIKGGNR